MHFYFDRSIFVGKKTPIYWEKINDFLLNQMHKSKNEFYHWLEIGHSEKKCLIYAGQKNNDSVYDYYISLFKPVKANKKDLYCGKNYRDESRCGDYQISVLPCVKSIKRNEDADLIILLVDQDIIPQTQVVVGYLSNFSKNTKRYLADTIEWASFSDIASDMMHCKKFISFSNNKILNQYFSALLGNSFILCVDDQSSPLRYAYASMKHPSLREKEQSPTEKNCDFKYSFVTSNLRNLVVEIEKKYDDIEFEITPEMIFKDVERQCLRLGVFAEREYLHCLKTRGVSLPFALEGWANNKRSLSELMLFTKQNNDNDDMKKLLLSYLLVYIPLDYWEKIEQRYINNPCFYSEFKKNIDVVSENSYKDYIFKWACGTYIRSLKNNKIYTCSWNDKSLASCLDLALNREENQIVGKVKQLYSFGKYEDSLGLNLVKVFVDNSLILKRKMSTELINVCHQLLDLDRNYGYGNYGASIFYKTLLLWLENKFNDIVVFFKQTLDGVKTRGFLAKTALFLLKQNRFDFSEIVEKLMREEDNVLLAKNPEMLQLKLWAYLELGDFENAKICDQYLRENKTYFKTFCSGFDKWYIQSCVEHKMKHFYREKRFKFIHEVLGFRPCLWEML